MIALACMTAQGFVLALLAGQGHRRQKTSSKQIAKIMKASDFYLLFINMFAWNFGGLMAFVFLGDLAKGGGISKDRAALLMSLVGVSSVVSRLVLGAIVNYVHLNEFFTFAFGCITRGIAVMFFPLRVDDWWYLVLWAVTSGIGYGVTVGMIVPTFLRIYPIEEATFAFSLSLVACAAGSLGGPPMAGRPHMCKFTLEALTTNTVVFNLFYQPCKSLLLVKK